MARKKVKTDTSAETPPASTSLAENVTQYTNGAVLSVPEAAVPTVDPVVTEEPVVEKPARASKKKASKPQAIEPIVEETPVVAKKSDKEKEQASGKAVKMKRLTLDIPKPLHKAIKAQAVEEGISIVDMLRTLLEQHYGK